MRLIYRLFSSNYFQSIDGKCYIWLIDHQLFSEIAINFCSINWKGNTRLIDRLIDELMSPFRIIDRLLVNKLISPFWLINQSIADKFDFRTGNRLSIDWSIIGQNRLIERLIDFDKLSIVFWNWVIAITFDRLIEKVLLYSKRVILVNWLI